MFTTYPTNSPLAAARVIAMSIMCDADIDSAEMDALDRFQVYQRLGITPDQFLEVFHQYCQDLMASTMSPSIRLMETRRVNEVLDGITEPQMRSEICQLILVIGEADGGFSDAELALFRHILEYWRVTLDGLRQSLDEKTGK